MFWKRSRREERYQIVLDELMDMDPAARRGRLDRAAAAGEVQVDEVESVLRLVGRLDALAAFTIRPNGAAMAPAAPAAARSGRKSSRATAHDARLAAARLNRTETPTAKLPAPRRGRSRAALAGSPAQPLANALSIGVDPAPPGSREKSRPSIDWLRP